MLAKLLYVIQAIVQDSTNFTYLSVLKQQSKIFENIFNRNINKMVNTVSGEIYKSLTGTNLFKEDDYWGNNNST